MTIPNIKAAIPGLFKEPAFYAKADFIKEQRILAVSLIALGILAIIASSFTGGLTAAIAGPAIFAGSALLGASLIQQVVGDAYGCSEGKVKRVVAGIFLIIGGPVGWLAGGILWYLSHKENRA